MISGLDPIDAAKRRILSKVPLDRLIGESVQLTLRSGKPVGLCPFHEEKSPSFYVYGDHYYCFGCKASGDAIDFVRKTQSLEFIAALRWLAGRFGIDAPELEESAHRVRLRNEDAALGKILAAAQEIFTAGLKSPRGEKARAYIASRGYTSEQIVEYGFGLTPEEPWGLVKALRLQGFREEDMKMCSLASTSEKTGRAYDFFRERIMIPIRDAHGRIIAFGGRTLVNDPAKYKNSAATRLFDKSAVLFGFDRAKEHAKRKRRMIVVEGYMDALQLWAQGFGETVAVLGTALSARHLQLIKGCAGDVVLLFDGDRAGQKASLDAVEVALEHPELQVRVAELPSGEDPDTFVRSHGTEALETLIQGSTGLVDFAVAGKLRGKSGLQIPDVVRRELIPWLSSIKDRVQRGFLVARLAQISTIPVPTLEQEIRMWEQRRPTTKEAPEPVTAREATKPVVLTPTRPLEQIEFDLLGHLYYAEPNDFSPELVQELQTLIARELSLDAIWVQFAGELIAALCKGEPAAATRGASTGFPEVQALTTRLVASAAAFKTGERSLQMRRLLQAARQKNLKKSISSLKTQIAVASRERSADVKALLEAIASLSKELSTLETSMRAEK
jgi:DNA primase